jgi:hypothetical protein
VWTPWRLWQRKAASSSQLSCTYWSQSAGMHRFLRQGFYMVVAFPEMGERKN